MILELIRKPEYTFEDRTIGGLYVDGSWGWWTLEDKDRFLEKGGVKIPKETAIGRGRHRIIIDDSTRFKRRMPHILDVPLFTGIRIHDGGLIGEPVDTEGCPLVGKEVDWDNKVLLGGKQAFQEFFTKLEWGLSQGEVWIEII